MKFPWYLIDTTEMTVQGANDESQVSSFRDNPEFIVLNAEQGFFFNGNNLEQDVTDEGLDIDPSLDSDDDWDENSTDDL